MKRIAFLIVLSLGLAALSGCYYHADASYEHGPHHRYGRHHHGHHHDPCY